MPEFNDVTALALLAGVLLMGERWANKMVTALTAHLERQALTFDAIQDILFDIQESLKNLNKQ